MNHIFWNKTQTTIPRQCSNNVYKYSTCSITQTNALLTAKSLTPFSLINYLSICMWLVMPSSIWFQSCTVHWKGHSLHKKLTTSSKLNTDITTVQFSLIHSSTQGSVYLHNPNLPLQYLSSKTVKYKEIQRKNIIASCNCPFAWGIWTPSGASFRGVWGLWTQRILKSIFSQLEEPRIAVYSVSCLSENAHVIRILAWLLQYFLLESSNVCLLATLITCTSVLR